MFRGRASTRRGRVLQSHNKSASALVFESEQVGGRGPHVAKSHRGRPFRRPFVDAVRKGEARRQDVAETLEGGLQHGQVDGGQPESW